MTDPVIHHGTPMTPRAALRAVGSGRAFCVSFWRPDDVEVVEAISPAIMFRQRRVLRMAGGTETRRAMVCPRRLATILRMVGCAAVSSRSMGGHSRRAGCAEPAQRQPVATMAVWSLKGCAALAHGRAARKVPTAGRAVRPRLHRLGGARTGWLPGLVPPHGRTGGSDRQSMASDAHDAGRFSGARISVRQCRRDQRRAKRVAI